MIEKPHLATMLLSGEMTSISGSENDDRPDQ
jgi:hypothetical protein